MGVRIVDLETDEVLHDSSKEKGDDLVPPYEYIEREEEPRLQEQDWTHPLHPERQDKIILDDETLAKLRNALEEWQRERREKDQ